MFVSDLCEDLYPSVYFEDERTSVVMKKRARNAERSKPLTHMSHSQSSNISLYLNNPYRRVGN